MTQVSVRVDLLMQMTRPLMHRGSSPAAETGAAVGLTLFSSSLVGLRVIALSLSRVRWSTSPVTGIWRLSWNDFTAAAVVAP